MTEMHTAKTPVPRIRPKTEIPDCTKADSSAPPSITGKAFNLKPVDQLVRDSN